ncbi:MAG TPA: protein translocase subunit SecF [Candidatus Dependentiae bacterium]|nr:protein translocase subunit SecF [Candidatus Dependentiae bacterium]HRQ63064.1 protein translocase subunit SecF [Candidatus Dependentiae bacterium]
MVNILKYRGLCALFSVLLLASMIGVATYKLQTKGEIFTYSIDFTGGTQVLLKFNQKISATRLKEVLEQKGWDGVVIRDFSSTEYLVRVKEFSNDVKGLAERIRVAAQEVATDTQVTIEESEAVGPGVGASLRWKSIWAVIYALIAMLGYIAFRFWSLGFAVGAVAALFHDALVMLAVFLLFNREISINVIGAILAVLGYSINDTIVIFARIRDNIKTMGNASLYDIVNTSINQTMRRTLLTSFTTGLTVASMFILGGEALRDFSLALLVGIVFGTYSSIYIASPIMMLLYRK